MAKPIKATPDLVGEEANRFIIKMLKIEKSKITKKEIKLAEEIQKNFQNLAIC
jgi:hypothetical protein